MKAQVFDFDDTLFKPLAMIHLFPFYNGVPVQLQKMPGMMNVKYSKLEYLPNALMYSITTREYSQISKIVEDNNINVVYDDGHVSQGHSIRFDFKDLSYFDVQNSKPIKENFLRLMNVNNNENDIWILTARDAGCEQLIQDFVLKNSGIKISLQKIICAGKFKGSTPDNKVKAFLTIILPSNNYEEVVFYDDDTRNLEKVKNVLSSLIKTTVINAETGESSSEAKDKVAKAKKRRLSTQDLRKIRNISGV